MTTTIFDLLAGKTLVVTGAAGGIGRSFAESCAAAGARVFGLDIAEGQQPATETLTYQRLDVSDPEAVERTFDRIASDGGPINGLFNNAGASATFFPIWDLEDALFEKMARINQFGAFYVLRAAMRRMRHTGGGAIVNTASTSGVRGVPGYAGYCASKHAVVGMTKVAALDGAAHAIRVNAVAPGMVDTPMNDAVHASWNPANPAEAMQQVSGAIPLGRYAHPAEIATTAAFLLSDAASYVTGQVLNADGGVTAKPGF